jgi:glycosyltransferase involved in cell wall biosynthesis
MLISVVVPTFNRADSLLNTLRALENQTFHHYEVIIVDDGSTDQTETVVKQFPQFLYVRQPNHGPAAARNTGSQFAQGEFITFTDDDCVPPADWLACIVRGYKTHPEVAGVGGPCRAPAQDWKNNPYARYEWRFERFMLPSKTYINWLTRGKLTWQAQWPGYGDYVGGMDCPAGRSNNISYCRQVFMDLNKFDESFPLAAGEDADFKIRLCIAGHQLLWLDRIIVEHRHAYTPQRFRAQHITYGRGVVYLEQKYRDQPPPRWRSGLRLLKRSLSLPFDMLTFHDRPLAWLKFQAGFYDAWGQFRR